QPVRREPARRAGSGFRRRFDRSGRHARPDRRRHWPRAGARADRVREADMRHPLRVLALSLALAAAPACAAFDLGASGIENPLAAAQTLDQRAYALLESYAAVLEEAADIVRDPATPDDVRRALARAEAAATPVVEALHAALAAHRAGEADQEHV